MYLFQQIIKQKKSSEVNIMKTNIDSEDTELLYLSLMQKMDSQTLKLKTSKLYERLLRGLIRSSVPYTFISTNYSENAQSQKIRNIFHDNHENRLSQTVNKHRSRMRQNCMSHSIKQNSSQLYSPQIAISNTLNTAESKNNFKVNERGCHEPFFNDFKVFEPDNIKRQDQKKSKRYQKYLSVTSNRTRLSQNQ